MSKGQAWRGHSASVKATLRASPAVGHIAKEQLGSQGQPRNSVVGPVVSQGPAGLLEANPIKDSGGAQQSWEDGEHVL
jgi:hypothetical protein